MILVMLLAGAVSVSAQTYCYRCIYKVSEDGVRIKDGGWTEYYTFINNKSVCYHSDKDGNKTQYGMTFIYEGSNNGILTYAYRPKDPYMNVPLPSKYIYFSSDYSRINKIEKSSLDNIVYTWVYEKVMAPDKQNAPTQLY